MAVGAAAALAVASLVGAARADAITFDSAITLSAGEWVLREQLVLDRARGGGREKETESLVSILAHGLDETLSLFAVVPLVEKRLETGPGTARSARGLGDVRLFGRHTVLRRDWLGGLLRVSPIAGIEAPTGEDGKTDSFGRLPADVQPGSGSWDPFAGLAVSYRTLEFALDGRASYQANTCANDFEFGDVARLDGSFQSRVWPRALEGGLPSFVYGVLEVNLIHEGRNRVSGAEDGNSGGFTFFLAPGLQYVGRRWVLEAAVQLPAYQDRNGTALEKDYVFRTGLRWNF